MGCQLCGAEEIAFRIESPDGFTAGEMCSDCVQEEIEPYSGNGVCAICDTEGQYHLNKLVHPTGAEEMPDEMKADVVEYEGFLCEDHFQEIFS